MGSSFQSSTVETRKAYKLGSATRPLINHDSGFSKFAKKSPGFSDYINLFKWTAMMEAAAALRPDLVDGVAAYNHFLNGKGMPRTFSYDRYVNNDSSGRITFRNAILDAQDAAIKLRKKNGKPNRFNITGPAIFCGGGSPASHYNNKAFPYPATENWQKAIGAHVIWVSASVSVSGNTGPTSEPNFEMDFRLHAEDQYNFNPGAKDIASGLPDDENGRFVVLGLAHGYLHKSMIKRNFSWKGFELGVASMGIQFQRRQAQPEIRG